MQEAARREVLIVCDYWNPSAPGETSSGETAAERKVSAEVCGDGPVEVKQVVAESPPRFDLSQSCPHWTCLQACLPNACICRGLCTVRGLQAACPHGLPRYLTLLHFPLCPCLFLLLPCLPLSSCRAQNISACSTSSSSSSSPLSSSQLSIAPSTTCCIVPRKRSLL